MKYGIIILVLLIICSFCWGQSLDPARFAEIQKQNTAALHNYTWKQRIELQVKGETKKTMLNLMRYDADGQQQKTPLSQESAPQQQSQSGGKHPVLKKKVVEHKKEEFKETMEGLAAQVQSYTHIPQDKLKAAMAKAEKLPPAGGMDGAVGLRLADVLQPKDSVTLWIDKATMLFREVDIATLHKENAVTVTAKYSKLPDGPNYMSKAVLQYPKDQIQVHIDSFDYALSTPSAAAPQKPTTPQQTAATKPPADPPSVGWPREIKDARGKLMVYQPQLEEWEKYTVLKGRSAVAFLKTGTQNPYFGIINLQAHTEVDHESRLVKLSNLQLTGANFPGLTPEQNTKMLAEIRKLVPPGGLRSISLDHVVASLEHAGAKNVDVNNDPPKIYVAKTPAILVIFDGKPVMSPIEKSDLKYAVNTNWDFFYYEKQQKYYLRNEASWLETPTLANPWSAVGTLPDTFKTLPPQENWKDVLANIPGKPIQQLPMVLINYEPAELILLSGEPAYQPIPQTSLLWVNNTKSDLIFDPAAKNYYYLVSGRWFSTQSLEKGPWTFVTPSLPEDFKKIPADHPIGDIRASIPGTKESEDAIIQASIPQTAKINKKEVKAPEVTYTGGKPEPEFQSIENTSLKYATNSAYDVIMAKNQYYLCYQGVWFVSTKPQGPWSIAETIPAEIYTIPPKSPVYHTTYVTVVEEDHTDDWVTVAVAAGYFGTIIASDCVVWGTGYYYPPYVWYGGAYPIYHPVRALYASA